MSELALQLIAENKKTKDPFLDLGNCGLENYLPKELGDCEWLKGLNLGYGYYNEVNKWIVTNNEGLPNNFKGDELILLKQLCYLNELNLCRNQISNIDFLTSFSNLVKLDLSENQITDFSFLTNLPNLSKLDISDNRIKDLRFLSGMSNLTQLVLSGNQIKDYSVISSLSNLSNLDLSFNQITDLSFFKGMSNLSKLDLRSNEIKDISFLSNLSNLSELKLRNNQIGDISPLSSLPNLTRLDLSSNEIKNISSLSGLYSLSILNLNNNQIEDSSFLSSLSNLSRLELGGNQIKDFRFLSGLFNLSILNIFSNQITDISFLSKMSILSQLDLSDNQIKDYSVLNGLSKLSQLYLSGNQISDISFLNGMSNLSHLDFSGNQITDFSFLSNLYNLTYLDIQFNQITEISYLANLSKLSLLDLRYNQITDISYLSNLSNLIRLSLSNNKIIDIKLLSSLYNLIELNISSNQISDIEQVKKICSIESINHLNVQNNPLPFPEDLDLSNINELRAYFKDAEFGVSTKRNVKLMFIGDGCAGKSTLFHHLKKGTEPPTIDLNDRTHGIALDIWQDAMSEVDIKVWDFGGQDIFHSTHRLFLGERAVYVLVWTKQSNKKCTEGEQHPLRYWLDFIADYGKNSTVILVENVIDGQFDSSEFPDDVSLEQLVQEYLKKGIRLDTTHHRIDCKHDTQKVKRFKTIIQSEIEQLLEDFPVKDFPANWHKVQESLEILQRNHRTISWSEYEAICQKISISNPQALLKFLNRSGVVSYYPNLFQNQIILQTDWILDAMYSFLKLRDNQFLRLEGKLNDSDFGSVWQEKYTSDEQSLFKSYMLKSEIMAKPYRNYYNIERAYQYLIPALFQSCKPHQNVKWDIEEHYLALKFKFVYNAIMQRLQVRILTYCHVKEEESFYKNRISFTDKQGKVAHIELLEDEKELRISAERDELYNDILKELNEIYPLDRINIIKRNKGKDDTEIIYNDKENSKSGFDKISINEINTNEHMKIEPIKIFVTYCWTDKNGFFDENHQKRVRAFVNNFSEYENFDATFDLYENELSTSTDFMKMMYENITKSKKVIIILSEGYQIKGNHFEGGVGIEYQGIINDINNNPKKYILVSFDNRNKEIYPFGMQGRDTVLIKNGDLEETENEENKNILFSKLIDEAIYERPQRGSKIAIVNKK